MKKIMEFVPHTHPVNTPLLRKKRLFKGSFVVQNVKLLGCFFLLNAENVSDI